MLFSVSYEPGANWKKQNISRLFTKLNTSYNKILNIIYIGFFFGFFCTSVSQNFLKCVVMHKCLTKVYKASWDGHVSYRSASDVLYLIKVSHKKVSGVFWCAHISPNCPVCVRMYKCLTKVPNVCREKPTQVTCC